MQANIDQIIENSLKKTKVLEDQLNSIEDKYNLNNVFGQLTGEDDPGSKKPVYIVDG